MSVNINLTAKNNCTIDGAYLVTLQTFGCDQDIGSKTLMGNGGNFGILQSSGQNITGTLVFAVPKVGLEFDVSAWIDASDGDGLPVSFTEGATVVLLSGVKCTGRSWSSAPGSPDYNVTVKYRAVGIDTLQ